MTTVIKTSSAKEVPPLLTPLALLGKKPRTKNEVENLAGEINPHPVLMQPLLSILGELSIISAGLSMLKKKPGILSYLAMLGGAVATVLGFFLQPCFNIVKKDTAKT